MSFLKRVISVCLVVVLTLSIFTVSGINASALSENARYYESIPEIAYATVGEPFAIYYKNILSLPGLKVVFDVPQELKKSYYDNKIEIKAEMPGDFIVPWRVYDSEYVLVDSGEMCFVARELALKNATALVLGDSTVNAGVVTQTLIDIYEKNGKTIKLLGTRGTYPNLHEGRGGWTSSMYCALEEQGIYKNPFFNGGFDFRYYMVTQGFESPDFVIIQLGINDIKKMTLENYSSKKVLSDFEKIILSIREYDENIKIILGVTIPPSEKVEDFNDNYVFSSEFEYRNNIIRFASDLLAYFNGWENVYFSPINCQIDTKSELKDVVHPTDKGYKNIAKQYVSTINGIYNTKIKVKAPEITSVNVSKDSLVLKWTGVYNAETYVVLRNDKVLAEVENFTYRDSEVSSGKTYKYQIKAICKNGKAYVSKVKTAYYLGAPVLKSATSVQKGVSVKWGAVKSAEEYSVYRKTANSSWAKIGNTTNTSFTDKAVKSGTKYFYTVIARKGDIKSSYDNCGVSVCYLSTPSLSSVANTNSGAKIIWKKVSGAKGYYVYRKTSKNGNWTKIGKTTSNSYLDKNVKSGGNYIYTVRAYNNKVLSSYVTGGIADKFLSAPVLSKAVSKANGVIVTYGKVTGASGYYVYRKTGNGSWVKIATVSGNKKTSYIDKTAQKGKTYTYTVRAINGKYISSYNAKGLTVKDKY